jgi:hypothetical protein
MEFESSCKSCVLLAVDLQTCREGKGHATERKPNKYKSKVSETFLQTRNKERNFLLWRGRNLIDGTFSLRLTVEEMAPLGGNQLHVFGRGAGRPRETFPLFVGDTSIH